MNWDDFGKLLRHLQPETIARIIIDLEQAREDWAYYPEEAPPEPERAMIDEAVGVIITAGDAAAKTNDVEFRPLLERLRDEQDEKAWADERDAQEVRNWLDDYK